MARAIYNRLAQGIAAADRRHRLLRRRQVVHRNTLPERSRRRVAVEHLHHARHPADADRRPGEAALRAALAPAEGEMIFWARTDENGIVGAHVLGHAR